MKEEMDERFKILEIKGITNLKELIDGLKQNQKSNIFQRKQDCQ